MTTPEQQVRFTPDQPQPLGYLEQISLIIEAELVRRIEAGQTVTFERFTARTLEVKEWLEGPTLKRLRFQDVNTGEEMPLEQLLCTRFT